MLFKILKGDSSRISTDITPFHDGWAYFTPDDGGFYIDSTDENGVQSRVRVAGIGAIGGGNSVAYKRVLTVSGWVNNQQTVTIAELTADQNGVAGLAQDVSTAELEATEAAAIYTCGQEDGKLIFALGGDKPTCDIPIVIILLK